MVKLNKKKVLILIPARKNSKGIKNKNILNFSKKKSLVEIAVYFSQKLKFADDIFISTDSSKIKKIIEKKTNLKIPFLRSKKNSTDKSTILSVIKEVLKKIRNKYLTIYETIILIEPTSPLRKLNDVINAYKKYKKNKYDSLWTINRVDLTYHPNKQLRIKKKQYLKFFNKKGAKITRRQMLEQTYMRNGVCYIFKVEKLIKSNTLAMNKTGYYLCDDEMISIDTPEEFKFAKKKFDKNTKYL